MTFFASAPFRPGLKKGRALSIRVPACRHAGECLDSVIKLHIAMDHRGDSRYPVGGFAGAKLSMDATLKELRERWAFEPQMTNSFCVIVELIRPEYGGHGRISLSRLLV